MASGAMATGAIGLAGCAYRPDTAEDALTGVALRPSAPVEYIVIGSGAGGGPLAANLARAGHKVVLMEAGGADDGPTYAVPAFHPFATEDPALSWAYYVRHYTDEAQQQRDSKFVAAKDGIFYPRSGTLGGCTAHHAMITVTPDNADWDHIAETTGDESWRAGAMRVYFQRLERCRYRSPPPYPLTDPSRHGYNGWLTTTVNDPLLLARDKQLQRVALAAAAGAGLQGLVNPLLVGGLDPNDWRVAIGEREGLFNIPVSIRDGRRAGTREYIQRTAAALPNNLVVKTNALVARILFDGTRAIGVEYLDAPRLYRADPRAPTSGPEPTRQRLLAAREVIVAAGAFNSPQILKLSGIGPRDELARVGISPVVDLPGVGENLQDRYEMGVVTRMRSDFALLKDCSFQLPGPGAAVDPCYAEWLRGSGVYATNGTVVGIIRRSVPSRTAPDLFIFGIPGYFRGYYPGYSEKVRDKDFFTWAILKAHTRNTAGSVTLRSADPRDPPEINFRYFAEGNDSAGEDLQSVVAGIEFVRSMNRVMYGPGRVADIEVVPGPSIATPDAISSFVGNEAWGHHASCSNKMGLAGDPTAVVDSRFRVHGTQGLRVVDASVFPRIPGFFIVTPIYTISEKASDVILADASAPA